MRSIDNLNTLKYADLLHDSNEMVCFYTLVIEYKNGYKAYGI